MGVHPLGPITAAHQVSTYLKAFRSGADLLDLFPVQVETHLQPDHGKRLHDDL